MDCKTCKNCGKNSFVPNVASANQRIYCCPECKQYWLKRDAQKNLWAKATDGEVQSFVRGE